MRLGNWCGLVRWLRLPSRVDRRDWHCGLILLGRWCWGESCLRQLALVGLIGMGWVCHDCDGATVTDTHRELRRNLVARMEGTLPLFVKSWEDTDTEQDPFERVFSRLSLLSSALTVSGPLDGESCRLIDQVIEDARHMYSEKLPRYQELDGVLARFLNIFQLNYSGIHRYAQDLFEIAAKSKEVCLLLAQYAEEFRSQPHFEFLVKTTDQILDQLENPDVRTLHIWDFEADLTFAMKILTEMFCKHIEGRNWKQILTVLDKYLQNPENQDIDWCISMLSKLYHVYENTEELDAIYKRVLTGNDKWRECHEGLKRHLDQVPELKPARSVFGHFDPVRDFRLSSCFRQDRELATAALQKLASEDVQKKDMSLGRFQLSSVVQGADLSQYSSDFLETLSRRFCGQFTREQVDELQTVPDELRYALCKDASILPLEQKQEIMRTTKRVAVLHRMMDDEPLSEELGDFATLMMVVNNVEDMPSAGSAFWPRAYSLVSRDRGFMLKDLFIESMNNDKCLYFLSKVRYGNEYHFARWSGPSFSLEPEDMEKLEKLTKPMTASFWEMYAEVTSRNPVDHVPQNIFFRYGLTFQADRECDEKWNKYMGRQNKSDRLAITDELMEELVQIMENRQIDCLPSDINPHVLHFLGMARLFISVCQKRRSRKACPPVDLRFLLPMLTATACIICNAYHWKHTDLDGWGGMDQKDRGLLDQIKEANPDELFDETNPLHARMLKIIHTSEVSQKDGSRTGVGDFPETILTFLIRIRLTDENLIKLRTEIFVSAWERDTPRRVDCLVPVILESGFQHWKETGKVLTFSVREDDARKALLDFVSSPRYEIFPYLDAVFATLSPTFDLVKNMDMPKLVSIMREALAKGDANCARSIISVLSNVVCEWDSLSMTADEIFQFICLAEKAERGLPVQSDRFLDCILWSCPNIYYRYLFLKFSRRSGIMPFSDRLLTRRGDQREPTETQEKIAREVVASLFWREKQLDIQDNFFLIVNDDASCDDIVCESLGLDLASRLLHSESENGLKLLSHLVWEYPFLFFDSKSLAPDDLYKFLVERIIDSDGKPVGQWMDVLYALLINANFADRVIPKMIQELPNPEHAKLVPAQLCILEGLSQYPAFRLGIVGLMVQHRTLDNIETLERICCEASWPATALLNLMWKVVQSVAVGNKLSFDAVVAVSKLEAPFSTLIQKPLSRIEEHFTPERYLFQRVHLPRNSSPCSYHDKSQDMCQKMQTAIRRAPPKKYGNPPAGDWVVSGRWFDQLDSKARLQVLDTLVRRQTPLSVGPLAHAHLLTKKPWIYHWIIGRCTDLLSEYHYGELWQTFQELSQIKEDEQTEYKQNIIAMVANESFVRAMIAGMCKKPVRESDSGIGYTHMIYQLLSIPAFKEALINVWNELPYVPDDLYHTIGMMAVACCIPDLVNERKLALLLSSEVANAPLGKYVAYFVSSLRVIAKDMSFTNLSRILISCLCQRNSIRATLASLEIIETLDAPLQQKLLPYIQHVITGLAYRRNIHEIEQMLKALRVIYPNDLNIFAPAVLSTVSEAIQAGHQTEAIDNIIAIFSMADSTIPTRADMEKADKLTPFWRFVHDNTPFLTQKISVRVPMQFNFMLKVPFLCPYAIRLGVVQRVARAKLIHRLAIRVRREHVFEDSFTQLSERRCGLVHVKFVGERGVDASGLTREWFTLVTRALTDPNYALFKETLSKTSLQPNPASGVNPHHLAYFEFAGKVCALAIMHEIPIPCHFCRPMLKLMLGLDVGLEDLEDIDHNLYTTLRWLLDNSVQDLPEPMTFTADSDELGVHRVAPLKPDGASIAVTNENKAEFVALMAKHRLVTEVNSQLEAFLKGFHGLLEAKDLLFDPDELDFLICGPDVVDVDQLQANCEYTRPYNAKHPVVQRFFRVLKKWSQKQLTDFLMFLTGSPRTRIGGFTRDRGNHMTISYGGSDDRLPQAHTCTSTIDLPEYGSDEVMNAKLLMAIENCRSFGFA